MVWNPRAFADYVAFKNEMVKTLEPDFGTGSINLEMATFNYEHAIKSKRIKSGVDGLRSLLEVLEQADELGCDHVGALKTLAEMSDDHVGVALRVVEQYEREHNLTKASWTCICGKSEGGSQNDFYYPLLLQGGPTMPVGNNRSPDLDCIIDFIVENISTGWKNLARKLIREVDIDVIEVDNREVKERSRKMLGLWRENNGKEATVGILIESLKKCRRKDLADQIESGEFERYL